MKNFIKSFSDFIIENKQNIFSNVKTDVSKKIKYWEERIAGNVFALKVLNSIKKQGNKATTRQISYLDRAATGQDKPEYYHPKN